MKTIKEIELLELGCYYIINGTKKILYWDGEKWMKPEKDSRGRKFSGLISYLEKQPKFKFAELYSTKDDY